MKNEYPPLKFKCSGGPLDGEDWLYPASVNVQRIIDEDMKFQLSRTRENEKGEKEKHQINARYKVEFDKENKTFSATFVEPDNG